MFHITGECAYRYEFLELLSTKFPGLDISDCKIHLAVFNGDKHSVDVFLKNGKSIRSEKTSKDSTLLR